MKVGACSQVLSPLNYKPGDYVEENKKPDTAFEYYLWNEYFTVIISNLVIERMVFKREVGGLYMTLIVKFRTYI